MATLDRQELFRLARLGAEARLRALEMERTQILRSFPGLKAGATAAPSGVVDTHASRTGGQDCSNSLDFPRDSTRR